MASYTNFSQIYIDMFVLFLFVFWMFIFYVILRVARLLIHIVNKEVLRVSTESGNRDVESWQSLSIGWSV